MAYNKDRSKKNQSQKRAPKGKSGKYSNKESVEPETSAKGNNDPSWYIPDPMVMEQATRISFDDFVGVPIDMDPGRQASLDPTATMFKPGAIMQVFMNPSPGYTGLTDPKVAAINQQGFRTYARLSSINAKNTSYLPNDVTTMILAMGELISLMALAQRAYGLLWTYNVRNRTMPTMLVDLSGVKAETLRATAAPYLTRLNTLFVEANKIPFPSNIDYFKKCSQIYSSVYTDSDTDMAELYVPLPYSTWDLTEDEIVEGTYLKTRVLYSDSSFVPMEPNALLDLIEDKINVMLTSATYNYVYSDIINLATKDPSVQLLQFTPLDFNYSVMPVHDREWLLKINNATILGKALVSTDQYLPAEHTTLNDVIPDVDSMSLLYAPQFKMTYPSTALDRIINFTNEAPTMEERLVATRLYNSAPLIRMGATPGGTLTAYAFYTKADGVAMGDHYVSAIAVYTDSLTKDYAIGSSGFSAVTNYTGITTLTRFSQHPYLYEFDLNTTTKVIKFMGMLGDMDFFTQLEFGTINKINKLALFALFDVKDVTKSK